MKTAVALIAVAVIAHAEPVMEKQLLFGGATAAKVADACAAWAQSETVH